MCKKISILINKITILLGKLESIPLLALRLVIAYGFYDPALNKLNNVESTASWFESMGYPFPTLNVYLSGYTELIGGIMIGLGLATRFVSPPLMFVMVIAITTVHWDNGIHGKNGFEIPLLYLLCLFLFFVKGPGKLSLDELLNRFLCKDSNTE